MIKIDIEKERIEKELSAKLSELMGSMQGQRSVPSTSNGYELAANALQDHAMGNVYSGPSISGPMFAGWPLSELLALVPYGERSQVAAVLKSKMNPITLGGVGGTYSQQASRFYSLEQMMSMRMRWQEGALLPEGFTHMAMQRAGDQVHVWIITKDGESLILHDELGLYPSDTLITKIRLLQRGETS